jgi:small-conductance mechanosensitive channel
MPELLKLLYVRFVTNAVPVALLLILAFLATLVTRRIIRALRKYVVKIMLQSGGVTDYEREKRAQTIALVVGRTLSFAIWTAALLMALEEMRFDVRPLLAGAGVIGVAIGFGAQNIFKDVIAGVFLLMENQIRINDVAVINGSSGVVEEINLRTTVLRSEDGAVHIFPNGGINSLANLTRGYSYAMLSISVSYREDTDRVVAILKELGEQLGADEAYRSMILAPLEVLGVETLADSGVLIKARFKTVPSKQWIVRREMNRRILKRFEEDGIALPADFMNLAGRAPHPAADPSDVTAP